MTYPEGASVRVEDMEPVERAYAEAMHEDCEDGPPHPLSAHSPWSGADLDGTEPWPAFVSRLARYGLSLTLTPIEHMPQSLHGCVNCNRQWYDHTPEEKGRWR